MIKTAAIDTWKHVQTLMVFIFLSVAATTATAEPNSYFDLEIIAEFEFGLFCDLPVSGHEDAPETELGKIYIIDGDTQIASHTATVPNSMGANFGVRLKTVNGLELSHVEFRTTHPPFKTSGSSIEKWYSPLGGDGYNHHSFTFEYDYEMVAGPWVFEAFKDDHLLYRIQFDVVAPEDIPFTAQLCKGPALSS